MLFTGNQIIEHCKFLGSGGQIDNLLHSLDRHLIDLGLDGDGLTAPLGRKPLDLVGKSG